MFFLLKAGWVVGAYRTEYPMHSATDTWVASPVAILSNAAVNQKRKYLFQYLLPILLD